ncbi:hypothetical protein MBLNU230_g1489t1 [Neophaeotheca triangularis]
MSSDEAEMAAMLRDLGEETRETISAMPDRLANINAHQQANLLRAAEAHRAGARGDEKLSQWNNPDNFEVETIHASRTNYFDGQGHRRANAAGLRNRYDQGQESIELRVGEERAQWLTENRGRSGPPAPGNYTTSGGRGNIRDSIPRAGPSFGSGRLPPPGPRQANPNRAPSPRASGTVRFGRDGKRIQSGATGANAIPLGSTGRNGQRVQSGATGANAIPLGSRARVPTATAPVNDTPIIRATNSTRPQHNNARGRDVPLATIMAGAERPQRDGTPATPPRARAAAAAAPRNAPAIPPPVRDATFGRDSPLHRSANARAQAVAHLIASQPPGNKDFRDDIVERRHALQASAFIQQSSTYGEDFYRAHPERRPVYLAVRRKLVREATLHAADPTSEAADQCYTGNDKVWLLEAAIKAREMVRTRPEDEVTRYYEDHPEINDFLGPARAAFAKEKAETGGNAEAKTESRSQLAPTSVQSSTLAKPATVVDVAAQLPSSVQNMSLNDGSEATPTPVTPASVGRAPAALVLAKVQPAAPGAVAPRAQTQPQSAPTTVQKKKGGRVKMVVPPDEKEPYVLSPAAPMSTANVFGASVSSSAAPTPTPHAPETSDVTLEIKNDPFSRDATRVAEENASSSVAAGKAAHKSTSDDANRLTGSFATEVARKAARGLHTKRAGGSITVKKEIEVKVDPDVEALASSTIPVFGGASGMTPTDFTSPPAASQQASTTAVSDKGKTPLYKQAKRSSTDDVALAGSFHLDLESFTGDSWGCHDKKHAAPFDFVGTLRANTPETTSAILHIAASKMRERMVKIAEDAVRVAAVLAAAAPDDDDEEL